MSTTRLKRKKFFGSFFQKRTLAFSRYRTNDDTLVATANLIALVLAWNTPFYPLYLWWAVGSTGLPWILLPLWSFPLMAAVPALSRHHSRAGRAAVPLIGTMNTALCTFVLGEASGTALFYVPCILVACLLFRPHERRIMLPTACLPLVLYFLLHGHTPAPPHIFTDAQNAAMLSLNAASLGTFTLFLGLVFAGLVSPSAELPQDRLPRDQA